MHKWLLFLLIIILKEVLLYESTEFYSYDLIKNSITKFSPERIFIEREKDKIYQFDLEIMLPARERKFHLLMYEDVAFRESFLLRNGSDTRFYEGIVKGDPSSSVLGFIHNGVFSGSLKTSHKTYFVEPAHSVLDNIQDTQLSVLYSNNDIIFPENTCKSIHSNLSSLDIDVEEFYKNAKAQRVLDGLTCLIEMVSDHTLYEYLNKDENKVLAFLYLHSKYTDYIFRNTDFDGDGKADNVRIVQTATHIYKSKSDSNYPMAESVDVEKYLYAFRWRAAPYCLSVSMLHRICSGAVGMAFAPQGRNPDNSLEEGTGGICFANIKTGNSIEAKNIAVVNTVMRKKSIPLGRTLVAVAHEVGHAFGADDDRADIPNCFPYAKGEYVMSPWSHFAEEPWIEKFSGCSIIDINRHLNRKAKCLLVMPPVCGNNIRDPGEECDCGVGQEMCDALDPCCTPADVAPPEKGCTVRSSKGYVCSTKEDECCDDTCHVASGKPCLYMVNPCYPSVCDGKQTACPKPRKPSNKAECKGAYQYCLGGFCENTICRKVGYLNCICNDTLTKDCSVCCVINGTCKPASVIGLRSLGDTNIFLPEGTPCFSGLYNCSDDGKCLVSCSSILKSGALYWFITFIIFTLRQLLSVV